MVPGVVQHLLTAPTEDEKFEVEIDLDESGSLRQEDLVPFVISSGV